MENIFKEKSTEAVLLVYAANASNSINGKVFLHSIFILCSAISTFVINCCSTPAQLFVIAGIELRSNEGTTLGDTVSVAIYALGIRLLKMMMIELVITKCDDIKMVALADDFTAAAKLKSDLQWWTKLLEIGQKFVHFPVLTKSWLIVKFETMEETF